MQAARTGQPMDAAMSRVLAACIVETGHKLKEWIAVLDTLAQAHAEMCPAAERHQTATARVMTQTTLDLALALSQAYARVFNALVQHAIDEGMPGVVDLSANCKLAVSDTRAMYDAMVAQARVELGSVQYD